MNDKSTKDVLFCLIFSVIIGLLYIYLLSINSAILEMYIKITPKHPEILWDTIRLIPLNISIGWNIGKSKKDKLKLTLISFISLQITILIVIVTSFYISFENFY